MSFASPSRRWTVARSKSLIPGTREAPKGSHGSDINKKISINHTIHRLNVFLRRLTSLRCEICDGMHLRGEIRALEDLRSLCTELLIDCLEYSFVYWSVAGNGSFIKKFWADGLAA